MCNMVILELFFFKGRCQTGSGCQKLLRRLELMQSGELLEDQVGSKMSLIGISERGDLLAQECR